MGVNDEYECRRAKEALRKSRFAAHAVNAHPVFVKASAGALPPNVE
jgi:hypothetical protein